MQDSTSRTDQEGRDSVKDSLDDTYFLLWRSILDKPHFADPNLLKVWVWCLAKASYKSRCLPVRTGRGTTTVNIQRGQFLYGRKAAAEELNMPEGSVRDRMQRLQELESIAFCWLVIKKAIPYKSAENACMVVPIPKVIEKL